MSDTIYLIGRVGSHDGLASLPVVIGSGVWGELHPKLVYESLSALLTHGRSLEASRAAREIATSRNFTDAYLFDAYTVMVQGEPRRWADDFQIVGNRLLRIKQAIEAGGDEVELTLLSEREFELIETIHFDVPLADVATALMEMDPVGEPAMCWLLQLLLGPRGFLGIADRATQFVLWNRTNRAVTISLRLRDEMVIALERLCLLRPGMKQLPRLDQPSTLGIARAIRRTCLEAQELVCAP